MTMRSSTGMPVGDFFDNMVKKSQSNLDVIVKPFNFVA